MSDVSDGPTTGSAPEFETGRYLYCVVDTADATGASLSVEGIGGQEPYLVTGGDLAAVVQPCESLYDSEDPAQVKRWLLQHQTVVEAVGERFDTPLPFRFDTVLQGDDDGVREWLETERESLADALASVAGRWEYRVEVTGSDERFEEEVVAGDERLSELRSEIEAASEGTAYMKERQYERRLSDRLGARWDEEMATLASDLEALASEVRETDPSGQTLAGERERESADHRTVFTLLASEEGASAVGDRLDETASKAGVEVRFTGPWPPYSFTPTLGDDP